MMDRVIDTTVRIKFTTNNGDGAPVAPSSAFAVADFRIYKDGSAAEKTSTNGITVTSPLDSVVGRHLIEIDTSNDTGDAGFWAAGSEYWVEINSAKTVDSQSQSGVEVGRFRLVAADVVRTTNLPANFADLAITVTTGTVTAELDPAARVKLDASQPDYAPLLASGYTAPLTAAGTRTALGMSAADLDSQLDAILAAAPAGAGTGARTVTITVNDGTTALQNAVVRFTEGSNTFRAFTNASGVATFNLDDATYTVAVTKSGYTYAGTTMVVDGTETATYSMTATNVASPTNPDLSAIEVLCLDEDFEPVAGVEVDFRMAAIASGDQNRAYPGAKKTVSSNSSGIARFEGPEGATIEWKRGTGQVWTAVTLDNDSVTNVTSLIGSP